MIEKNATLEGEEMIKIPSGILIKKGNDKKTIVEIISKFVGEVVSQAIFLRRKSNIMSKERIS